MSNQVYSPASTQPAQAQCFTSTACYQEERQPAQLLRPGATVVIALGVAPRHGATATDWFAYLAINPSASQGAPVWREPLTDEVYSAVQA